MIIDLVIIAIILGSAMAAAKKGLLKTVYQLVASIVSLVVALMIYPVIEKGLKLTPLYSGTQNWIEGKIPPIDGIINLQQQNDFIQEVTTWMPEFISEYLVRNNNSEAYRILGVDNLISYISVWITDLFMLILAVMIAWIIVKIGLSVIVMLLDVVSKLPILKTVNSVVGFGVGMVKGVFTVWMLLALVPIALMIPELAIIEVWMQEATLASYLYDHNLILELINNVIQ